MLLSHLIRLYVTSASLIAASPVATVVSRAASLPSILQQKVPLCAQSCLQVSLVEKFPVACNGQDSLQCLCSRYSNSGESLGEVTLGCVYSGCSTAHGSASAAYNVCSGQQDAVMPTKTALTVVASSAPRTTTSTSPTSLSVVSPTITSTLRTQVSSTQSAVVDSISVTPSATSVPSAALTAAPAAADPTPKMTPAQIAGLCVAAVAAFVIAVGLMALSVCLRRRRERKNEFDSDEKALGQKSKKSSSRFSHYVTVGSMPEPPKQFPMALPAVALLNQAKSHPATLHPIRPVQRNGVGTSNSSSNLTLPLDQIGVAISAELDGSHAAPRITANASSRPGQSKTKDAHLNVPNRPLSTMTQDTVFEEDDVTARHRSSVLLPTPPVPVPPIRSLQPSKRAATFDNATQFPFPASKNTRQVTRQSDLFLEIPRRHERPQPKRIIATEMPSSGSSQQLPPTQENRLAPPIRMASSSSPHRTPGSSNTGDIDDYYFSAYSESTPRANTAHTTRSRDSPKAILIKSKRSGSTMSRTASRASTNYRDSVSSQTSFETADPSDPTPDDEDDDKQLSDENQLSPVAESPISHLRYPKVPRASNQLVPRRSRSPQGLNSLRSPKSQSSPRRDLQPSPPSASHLHNRRKDLAPPLLESRLPLRLNAPKDIALIRDPLNDPFTTPPRVAHSRGHMRSISTESWTTTPRSKVDRKSRTQSGMWPRSPAMYDEFEMVKPLNVKRKEEPLSVRRNQDEMKEINVGRDVDHDAEMNGMKSPVWVPRLTPTRKGEDLFISVGWGGR